MYESFIILCQIVFIVIVICCCILYFCLREILIERQKLVKNMKFFLKRKTSMDESDETLNLI